MIPLNRAILRVTHRIQTKHQPWISMIKLRQFNSTTQPDKLDIPMINAYHATIDKVEATPSETNEDKDSSNEPNINEQVNQSLNPQKIVEELDKHIIGQSEAKRSLAVALRDRWRRWHIKDSDLRREITPNNILLIGPSGCGKTELAKRLAAFAEAPFVKVVATKYTEVGIVGDDTQSMVQDLADQALADEKRKQRNKVAVEARLKTLQYIVSCVRQLDYFKDWTDQMIIEHIKNGWLDDLMIKVDSGFLKRDDQPQSPLSNIFNNFGGGGPTKNTQRSSPIEMTITTVPYGDLSSLMNNMFSPNPKKRSKDSPSDQKNVLIRQAFPILEDYFVNELINEEDVNEAARQAAEQRGIIFIDEFDKIIDSKDELEFKSKRKGVQKELLSLMEGTTVSTQLGRLSTDHVLFVASGAFTSTKPSDIMPELLGRLPIRCELKPLTENDFFRILNDVQFNLMMQQKALLATENVELDFTQEAIQEIAKIAYRLNTDTSNVGARRLKSVMAKILEDIKFDAPKNAGKEILITAEIVQEQLASLLKHSDLTKYII